MDRPYLAGKPELAALRDDPFRPTPAKHSDAARVEQSCEIRAFAIGSHVQAKLQVGAKVHAK